MRALTDRYGQDFADRLECLYTERSPCREEWCGRVLAGARIPPCKVYWSAPYESGIGMADVFENTILDIRDGRLSGPPNLGLTEEAVAASGPGRLSIWRAT